MAIKQIMRIDRHPSPDVTLRIKTNIRWQMAINPIAIRHRMLVYKKKFLYCNFTTFYVDSIRESQ